MTEFFFHVVFSAFLFIPSLHLPSFNNYLPESTAGVFQYLRKTAIYKFCHEKGCPGRPGSMPCSPGKAQGSPGDCHKLGELTTNLFSYSSRDEKSEMGLTELKSRWWQWYGGSRGKFFPCLFYLMYTACISWLLAVFHPQSHQWPVKPFSPYTTLTRILFLSFPIFEGHICLCWVHLDNPR